MNNINFARQFAIDSHGDQKYGDLPYIKHLDDVVDLLAPYGEDYQIVGYLHDVLEDTTVSEDVCRETFGNDIVDAMLVCKDEAGHNRKERKAKTNEKLRLSNNVIGLVVKAADRLANMKNSFETNKSLFKMYAKEYEVFKEAAYREGLCDEFWEEMDGLLGQSTALDFKI